MPPEGMEHPEGMEPPPEGMMPPEGMEPPTGTWGQSEGDPMGGQFDSLGITDQPGEHPPMDEGMPPPPPGGEDPFMEGTEDKSHDEPMPPPPADDMGDMANALDGAVDHGPMDHHEPPPDMGPEGGGPMPDMPEPQDPGADVI